MRHHHLLDRLDMTGDRQLRRTTRWKGTRNRSDTRLSDNDKVIARAYRDMLLLLA